MMAFDLKPLLLAGSVLLLGSVFLGIWLGVRLAGRAKPVFPADVFQLVESAPYGFILLDASSHTSLFANAYACRWLGISPGEMQIPDLPWKKELEQDLAEIAAGESCETRYRTLTLPNEQTLNWWVCVHRPLALVIVTDLSGQRKVEKTARLFLSNLSHELRSPLTAILSHAELLRSTDIPEPARQNALNLIHEAAERITRLVQDLLELSRLEASAEFDPLPVDLLLAAEQAIAEVILFAEERQIEISLEADAPLPRVLGEPDRLKRALLNLLENAVKYGRVGDRVAVRLSNQAGGVLVTVQDTGPGIPPAHLPHVKQRLYRVNKDVPGSGIGLALVDEIVSRHRSHLVIESRSSGDETGTSISFVLQKVSAP
ncbi:MAG: sensor histidine kinase [Chloroflexota bacterium]